MSNKVTLEVDMLDRASSKADKTARALDRMMAREAKANAKAQERLGRQQEKAHARAQAQQARAEARQQVQAERAYVKAQSDFKRSQEKREKLRRQDIINHARGVAKKDRLDKRAADKREQREKREAAKAIRLRERVAEKTKRAAEKAHEASKKGFSVAGAAAGSFIGGIGVQAVNKVVELGAAAVSTAHDFAVLGERTRFAMEAVSGGKWKVDDLLTQSDDLAVQFGLDLFATRQQFRDLLDLELEPGQIDHFVKLGASMQAAGESAESADLMLKALTKVKTKGVLDTKGLMALGAAGVQRTHLLKALGDELGIANADEEDLAEALGKKGMKADKALPLIERALMEGVGEKQAGEFAKRFAVDTLAGRENVVKTKGQRIGLRAAENNKGGLQDAVGVAEDAINSGKAQEIADKGASWISDMWSGIAKVGNDLLENGLVSKGDSTIDKWMDGLFGAEAGAAIMEKATGSGSAVDAGLARGIDDGTLAVDAAARLGDRVVGSLDNKLQIHSPSRVLRGRGRFAGAGFALGLDDSTGEVIAAGESMADATVASVSAAPMARAGGRMAGAGGNKPQVHVGPITISGGNTDEIMADLERKVARAVEKAFDQLAGEVS